MKYKERRKFQRYEFSYPVDLKIFASDYDGIWLSAFLKDVSMRGFCIQLRDRYGRIALHQINNARVKIKILEPDGENMFLLGVIRWARSKRMAGEQIIFMGIECKVMPDWQVEKLEQFILLRGKDHKMLWNLWDTYIHRAAG